MFYSTDPYLYELLFSFIFEEPLTLQPISSKYFYLYHLHKDDSIIVIQSDVDNLKLKKTSLTLFDVIFIAYVVYIIRLFLY